MAVHGVAGLKQRAMAAYRRFGDSQDPEDLDEAVVILDRALDIVGDSDRDERAALLTSRGVIVTDRYQATGRVVDLEEGLANYRSAVELTANDSPRLAQRLSNLGTGLWEYYRATGGSEVLREALEVLDRAVRLTPAGSEALPGRVLNFSSALYDAISAGYARDRLDDALSMLRDALPLEAPPAIAAQLRLNLASFLMLDFDDEPRARHLNEAIALNQCALDTGLPKAIQPRAYSNLGNGLLAKFRRDGDRGTLEEAVEKHRVAVQKTSADEPGRIDYLTNLGTSLVELAREAAREDMVNEALFAWEEAWSWIDHHVGRAPIAHRLGWQDDLDLLSAKLVTALLSRPPAPSAARKRAVAVAEGSKSRITAELIGWAEIPVPTEVTAALGRRERELTSRLRELDHEEIVDREVWPPAREAWGSGVERSRERDRLLGELNTVWAAIAASGAPGAAFVELRRGAMMSGEELVRLGQKRRDRTALVSMLCAPEVTYFLLVRGDEQDPLVVSAQIDRESWATVQRRFQREVITGRGANRGEAWMDAFLEPFATIKHTLCEAQRVVIAPHRFGHLLPWAVIARRSGWTTETGLPLPTVVTPTLPILARLPECPSGEPALALVVGDPRGDLRHARAEAEAVAARLDAKPLIGSAATIEHVTTALRDADVAHVAAHAWFDGTSPLDSGIELADGVLAVREIMKLRLHLDLLVLSACETAVGAPLAGDELMGVAQSFLGVGVRSLVVTLWPVNDRASHDLMLAFHRGLTPGADRAAALAQARQVVEHQVAWRHPYFWGAVELLGAWW